MANTALNTEGKEIVPNDEFMKGFGIESTNMLDNNELASFLDSDESIIGNPDDVTSTDDTPPPPPAKTTKNTSTKTEPDNAGKSKEQIAAEKQQAKEAIELENKQKLESMLEDDDTPPVNSSSATTKKVTNDNAPVLNEEEAAIQENLGSVSKEFFRLGLFSKDSEDEDEEIRDPKKFVEKAHNTFKKGAFDVLESYLSRYGEKHRVAFNAIYEKGVDPEVYLAQQQKVESFKKMDLKQEENQESVVIQALRNQGWEEEDIKDEVKKLKSYSELESTATKYHKGLVKSEEAATKKLEEDAQREEARKAQIDEEYETNLRNVYTEKLKTRDFDGIPVTEAGVTKAYDFAYNKKWELNGALLTDFDRFVLDLKKPENHAVKAQLALLFASDYDPNKPIKVDFSKIQKKAVSNEKQGLFKDLAKKEKASSNGRTAYANVTKSFFE